MPQPGIPLMLRVAGKIFLFLSVLGGSGMVTWAAELGPLELYQELRAFRVDARSVSLQNLVLKRDRVEMSFSGDFYFATSVGGRVYGAVFLGQGRLRTRPWSDFEKDNVKRFLKAETLDVDFSTAVLRFTDGTYEQLTASTALVPAAIPRHAQELAAELEERLVRETGLNLSARMALAVSNGDEPGFFFGQFDGGKSGRFSFVLDPQSRVPSSIFNIDAGEKGLLFQYRGVLEGNDIWTAFYAEQDFARGQVAYSDAFDLVVVRKYRLRIDLREPGDWLRYEAELDLVPLRSGVQWIPFRLNEGLDEYDEERLKKGVRVLAAGLADGTAVGVIEEPWETGFSLLLPQPLAREQSVTLKLRMEGKDSLWTWERFHYLRNNTTWYPRHSYLKPAHYTLHFRHRQKDRVVSIGDRQREGPADDNPEEWITEWVTRNQIALVAFAVGPFERHTELAQIGEHKIPLELYSLPGGSVRPVALIEGTGSGIPQLVTRNVAVKEDFVLAEMSNSVRFFSDLFGDYTFGRLGAVYFPAPFGQSLATLLFLPVEGYARTNEFAFIAHEGAHQWWGNIVAWRSYRDQWLSEGFAEYSGAMYTSFREKKRKREIELVDRMRQSLQNPPVTDVGAGSGKLHEVGPLILGHRLSTRKTRGAYSTLIYNKGALVLRMLNFLLSDPSTGHDMLFFDMMKDFVARHRNGWANTESFLAVASEHFARSPIGRKYRLNDLGWFFRQWVFQTYLPSYRLEYRIEPQEGGAVMLRGTLYQEGVPEDWFMVLPLVFEFPGNRTASGSIHALGPATSVEIRLPEDPTKVKLDPEHWILSEESSEKELKR